MTEPNVMRHEYKALAATEVAQMKSIKDIGLQFYTLVDSLEASREVALAMWATKHITR